MKKYKVKLVKTQTWEEIEVEAEDEEGAVQAAEDKIDSENLDPDDVETTDHEVEVQTQTYTVHMQYVIKISVEVEAESPEDALEQAGEDNSTNLGDGEFLEVWNESDWEVHDEDGADVTPGRRKKYRGY